MNLYSLLSGIRVLVRIKQFFDAGELKIFQGRQKIRKTLRSMFLTEPKKGYTFAILCVKRPEYVYLAIQNINSLHFFNQNHKFVLYVDKKCLSTFNREKRRLHYPKKVESLLFITNTKQAWQTSKVQMLINAMQNDQILTDADGIWRDDPKVSKEKVTFLVSAYKFGSNVLEKQLLEQVLKQKQWMEYTHFVTGFVSIPKKLVTKKLIKDVQSISQKILVKKFSDMDSPEEQSLRRLAEEIAVSLAVQINIPKSLISTLKKTDGPGNRKTLQSMYYGCANKIIN